MTAPRNMSKAERAALADALRHMGRQGVGYRELVRLGGVGHGARARKGQIVRRPA
ncbi:hypothetical protein [Devosia sp. 63-57]|uniref:hypothetical protein n=1 Tax=Devosia sp. 63-57 TaxID=1895751 RepID=UPI00257DA0B9|nr:hypothetical protein [Devosia sp. 63-57]